MIESVKNLYWHLPSPTRRQLFIWFRQKQYQQFQESCCKDTRSLQKATLYPFVAHECIFVHIPKSAGVSITNGLFGGKTGSHMRVVDYQIGFGQAAFDRYFKFTFVRNPWDRLVSAFFFLRKGGLNSSNKKFAERNLTRFEDFDAFVKHWVNKKNIRKYAHFNPQYTFICLPDKRKPAVDFIGYFENIEEDYAYVSNKLGVNNALPNTNVSDRNRDFRHYYSEETKQIVADVYDRDIELFGYDFDNTRIPTKQQRER